MLSTPPDRPFEPARRAAAEEVGLEAARADVDVLQHPVVFAVADHGVAEAEHHRADQAETGIGDVEIGQELGRYAAAGGRCRAREEHAHQHERAAHRLDEHVEREEPGAGPVGFELPAEPRGQAQSAKVREHEGMIREWRTQESTAGVNDARSITLAPVRGAEEIKGREREREDRGRWPECARSR